MEFVVVEKDVQIDGKNQRLWAVCFGDEVVGLFTTPERAAAYVEYLRQEFDKTHRVDYPDPVRGM